MGMSAITASLAGWTCVGRQAPGRGEQATGSLRINCRYYNPTDVRRTRRDPIGIEGGVNLYGYVQSNPMMIFDY